MHLQQPPRTPPTPVQFPESGLPTQVNDDISHGALQVPFLKCSHMSSQTNEQKAFISRAISF